TYGGAELGCPVASKVLEITSDSKFLNRVNQIATRIRNGLDSLLEKYPSIIVEIRQKGLFIGIKMSDEGYGPVLSLALIRNGIFAVWADNDRSVLQFLPPLILQEGEIEYAIERLDRAFMWVQENPEYLELARGLIS
ncbi:MAG: aminotransferase class III-fold pyridoxal phosphate-dependent enzyme, partial [Candidatus Hodarchaeota archaeon]